MAKFNTGNPLGSTDPRDLLDNSTIADHYVDDTDSESWPDRFGRERRTWHGMEMDSSRQLSSQEDRFQQFLLSSGYVILPDYVDGPITFTARNQITAYNGEFYRPKADVSLPYSTTGSTDASWEVDKANFVTVGDAALRQQLTTIGDGKSADMLPLKQGGTVANILENCVWVESFQSLVIDGDWGPAVRAALKYAASVGIKEVHAKNGVVKAIKSYDSVGWVSPYDDGTVSPNRISAGTDSNLAAEIQVIWKVGLNLPAGIRLVGGIYDFQWNYLSDPIDSNQFIGVVGRVDGWDGTYAATNSGSNRTHGGGTWDLSDTEIRNCLIPFIGDGIAVNTTWGKTVFKRCGIPALVMGSEACDWGQLNIISSYAGFVMGGWWLQRNANNYPTSMLPPYPASDINICGWNDVNHFSYLYWSNAENTFSARHKAIDALYNTYFYKQFHQLSTSQVDAEGNAGTGRLTRYLGDLSRDAYASTGNGFNSVVPYRGIASRALCILNRYGRWDSGYYVHQLKTLGNHRAPVWTTNNWAQSLGYVNIAYIERGGVKDASTSWSSSNDFASSGQDIWNVDLKTNGLVCQGYLQCMYPMNINSIQKPANLLSGLVIPNSMHISRNTAGYNRDDDSNYAPLLSIGTIDTGYGERFSARFGQRGIKLAPIGFDTYPKALNEAGFKSRSFIQAKSTGTIYLSNGDYNSHPISCVGRVTYDQTRSVVTAWYTITLPSDVSALTSNALIWMNSAEMPIPSPTNSDYYAGPYQPTIVVGRATTTNEIKGIGVANNGGDLVYLQLFTDQSLATPAKWSQFTGGSVLRFEVKYLSQWADE